MLLGLGAQLLDRLGDRVARELAVEVTRVDDQRRAGVGGELEQGAGGARLVDVRLAEADARRTVRVAVDLAVQLLRLGQLRLRLLP